MSKMIVFLLGLIILIVAITSNGFGNEIGKPVPCVDGQNRINLEGIMCENLESTWYGISSSWSLLTFIPIIIFGILIFGEMYVKEEKRE